MNCNIVMFRSDGTESPILEEQDAATEKPKQLVKYGELVILGYNGFLPQGDRGRRRSKFVLYKRQEANGVKRSKHYVVKTPHSSQAILDAKQHSISYTLSRNQAVIVEYTQDDDTDMFQVNSILFLSFTLLQSLFSIVFFFSRLVDLRNHPLILLLWIRYRVTKPVTTR